MSACGGSVIAPPLIIPAQRGSTDEFSVTVTALDDDDIVLVQLDSSNLSIELSMPSVVATDLAIRLAGCCMRLSRARQEREASADAAGAPRGRARNARSPSKHPPLKKRAAGS